MHLKHFILDAITLNNAFGIWMQQTTFDNNMTFKFPLSQFYFLDYILNKSTSFKTIFTHNVFMHNSGVARLGDPVTSHPPWDWNLHQMFQSLEESFFSYMKNLNCHPPQKEPGHATAKINKFQRTLITQIIVPKVPHVLITNIYVLAAGVARKNLIIYNNSKILKFLKLRK